MPIELLIIYDDYNGERISEDNFYSLQIDFTFK